MNPRMAGESKIMTPIFKNIQQLVLSYELRTAAITLSSSKPAQSAPDGVAGGTDEHKHCGNANTSSMPLARAASHSKKSNAYCIKDTYQGVEPVSLSQVTLVRTAAGACRM